MGAGLIATIAASMLQGDVASAVAIPVIWIVGAVVGFVAYIVLAAIWFGWEQSVGTTFLLFAASYAGADGVGAIADLFAPGFVVWFASFIALLSLLTWLLKLDLTEAIVAALSASIMKAGAAILILMMFAQ